MNGLQCHLLRCHGRQRAEVLHRPWIVAWDLLLRRHHWWAVDRAVC